LNLINPGKPLANHEMVKFLTNGKLVAGNIGVFKEYEKCSTESYANELHEALLQKNNTDFWKCWRSKFDSSNEYNQAEGFVDPDVIAQKFYNHF